MRTWHIRSQEEILERIHDAIKRGDQGDEFNEYMRCARFIPVVLRPVYEDTTEADWMDVVRPTEVSCDDATVIDDTARAMLPFLEQVVKRTDRVSVWRAKLLIRQFRAWKWLLGHPDADSFYVGRTHLRVFYVVRDQMVQGAWSSMTRAAKKGIHAANTSASANAQAVA